MNKRAHEVLGLRARGAPLNFATIPITLTAGTLAVADVMIDGVKVKALIDSGARHAIGNPQLGSDLQR